jgi:DNA-binding transcriptional LysR family regulator
MTPAAEALVQLGQRVSQDVRDTLAGVTDRTRELRGTLRLSGGMTVCLYIFPTLVKQLRRSHPKLDVKMMVATAGRSVEQIRAGHVDAGLLTLPVDEADLVTLPVLREELLLVTMPGHPLAKRKKIAAQDLAGEPFVAFEAGSGTRRVIDRFFLSENIEPNIVMDTENVEIIKAMVKTGFGIGIVPYIAVAREVRARQFFVTRIEGHELFRETGWVYPRANRTPRIIDELLAAFESIRGKIAVAAPDRI